MTLRQKNAVVTGGASGIGRAVVLRLAREGVNVAILDRDRPGAEESAGEAGRLGPRSIAAEVDVADFARVGRAVEEARRALGPIQILVHSAGFGEIAPLAQMTEAQWDRMIAVHLKGAFNCARHVVGDMIAAGWGRIVNVSSVAGLAGAPGFSHYAAAKAGLVGFTKALAREVASSGVTVNAIAPGLVDTPILAGAGLTADTIEAIVRRSPVQRIGVPDDIAAACAYAVSEEASFLTGQVLSPNGGAWM